MGYREYPRGFCMDRLLKVMLHKTIRNIDFSATQHYSIVATLLRMVTTLFQHCSNIATLCCAENRRCKSSRATSSLVLRTQYEINGFSRKTRIN